MTVGAGGGVVPLPETVIEAETVDDILEESTESENPSNLA
jgi:hypothetical protein